MYRKCGDMLFRAEENKVRHDGLYNNNRKGRRIYLRNYFIVGKGDGRSQRIFEGKNLRQAIMNKGENDSLSGLA